MQIFFKEYGKMITYDIFKNGCNSVFTMSYDDGKIEDRRLVALMNRYGIKGTFNLNSGRLGEENFICADEVGELYKGHEVAVHTVTHPFPNRCAPDTVYKEIGGDRAALERLVGYPVRGMAYPFGAYSGQVIEIAKNCGIVYSRTTQYDGFNVPEDFMRLKSTCHHNLFAEKINDFEKSVKNPWRKGMCFYVWGHSYELDSEEKWAELERCFKRITYIGSIWYATNIELCDYLTAQKNLRMTYDEDVIENPSNIDVWIRKDGKPVKIPKCSSVNL